MYLILIKKWTNISDNNNNFIQKKNTRHYLYILQKN